MLILEEVRDESMPREGRMVVEFFTELVLRFSKGLLILDSGAKIPIQEQIN